MNLSGRSSLADCDHDHFEYDNAPLQGQGETTQQEISLHSHQLLDFDFPFPPRSPKDCNILNELGRAIQGVKDLYQNPEELEMGRDSLLEWFQSAQEEVDTMEKSLGDEDSDTAVVAREIVKVPLRNRASDYSGNLKGPQQPESLAEPFTTFINGPAFQPLPTEAQPFITSRTQHFRSDSNLSTDRPPSPNYSVPDATNAMDNKWSFAHGYGHTRSTSQRCSPHAKINIQPAPPLPPKSPLRGSSKVYWSESSSPVKGEPENVPWSPRLYRHHWKRPGGNSAKDSSLELTSPRRGAMIRSQGFDEIDDNEDDYHSFISKARVSPKMSEHQHMHPHRYGSPRPYHDRPVTPPTSIHAAPKSGIGLKRWATDSESTESIEPSFSNENSDFDPGVSLRRQETKVPLLQPNSPPSRNDTRLKSATERGPPGENKKFYSTKNYTKTGIEERTTQREWHPRPVQRPVQPHIDQPNPALFGDPGIANTAQCPDSDSQMFRAPIATFDMNCSNVAEPVHASADRPDLALNSVSECRIGNERAWTEFCRLAREILDEVVDERRKTHASKAFGNAEKIEKNHYLDKKFVKMIAQAQKHTGYDQVDTITAVKQFMLESKRLGSVGNGSEGSSETTIPMTATVTVPQKPSRFISLLRILEKSVKSVLVVPSDSRIHPPEGSSIRGIQDSVLMDSNIVAVAEAAPNTPNTTVSMHSQARGEQFDPSSLI